MTLLIYSVLVEALTPEEGGGYAATVPDLPGCMSDGETPEDCSQAPPTKHDLALSA